MQCPGCNTENREGAKFCASCGLRLILACSQCGTELRASAKFCDACGAQVTARPPDFGEEPAALGADAGLFLLQIELRFLLFLVFGRIR